ncbi:MAG: hypothetical protein KC589_09160 [Nanoarchaeota archaeon]|nr:hypothetical protein [Nanoarchaeota archaeon]
MVFGWLYSVAYRKLGDDGLKGKLFKVLFSCSYCNTGQLALWSYLYLYREYDYSFYYHIMFISFSILIAHVLIKLLNKS